MQRNIKRLLHWLFIEFAATWAIAIITFLTGEFGWIPNGLYCTESGSQTEYYLNLTSIITVIVCIVLALQLFSLNTRKGLKRMNHEEALISYHKWSCIRLGMLLISAIYGIVVYFLLLNSTGILCACMAMVVTLACIPSEEKLNKYLEELDRNTSTDIQEGE